MDRREFVAAAAGAMAAGGAVRGAAGAKAPGAGQQPGGSGKRFTMAFGPHPGMFAAHAGGSIVDQVLFAADQGFSGWEDNGLKGLSKEEQEKIAQAQGRAGMQMGIFVAHSIDWGSPSLTSGKKEAVEKFVAEMKESVEVAKRMNTKVCTVVPGVEARNLPVGVQTANVVEALKRAAAVCEPSGLVMVCEPLNWRDHAGLFLRYSDQAYAIMKAVGSPSCKILFDIYHQQATEGNLIENIRRCWDEIGYFQIGDNPGRREPGTGEINYKNVFRAIRDKGYTGVLGMEHGNSKPGKEGEQAVIAAYREADPG
ncbi:MAG: TIM barrel protein [Phycisphaerae bacterium]|nr:TIM barrel protein [Phycisphaerae bacterium]